MCLNFKIYSGNSQGLLETLTLEASLKLTKSVNCWGGGGGGGESGQLLTIL